MPSKTNKQAKGLLMALLLFFSLGALAQKTVTGKVTNKATNQPIAGASVQVKGTTIGTQTGVDGSFSLKVPKNNSVLTVSFVGFDALEQSVSGSDVANFELTQSVSQLNEILVTGYTSQRKKDITGAVSVVNTKELVANPGSNVESLLQGQASGVTVGTSGVPGAGASVRIRGFSTFYANDPLFVVDGARVSSITDLNPNDIESLQVLKDGSSASVYGTAAANGVIIITTKRGKGKPKISYDAYMGTQSLIKEFNLLNTSEYGQYLYNLQKGAGQLNPDGSGFKNGQYGGATGTSDHPIIPEYILAGTNSGVQAGDPSADPSLYNLNLSDVNAGTYLIVKANKTGTDWMKAITKNAPITSHNLTVSGGNEAGNYLLGLNYFNQEGIIAYTGYKRYSLRANTNFKIKNVVRVGENLQVSYRDQDGFDNQSEGNAISMAYRNQPIIPVYDIKGNFAGTRGSNLGNASNPLADRYRQKDNKDTKIGIIGSLYAEVDFLKYFTFKSNVGVEYGNNAYYYFNGPLWENAEGRRNGTTETSFGEGQSYNYQLTWYNTLSFHKTFNKLHDVKVLAGTEIVQGLGRGVDANSKNYFSTDRNFWQVGSGLSTTPYGTSGEYAFRKYSPIIAKLDYAYNEKYLLSASFRRDGSATIFGPLNKYGNFASASVGWRLTEESFLRDKFKWLNDLKLRVGYGTLGNDNISSFGFLTTYVFNSGDGYPIDGSNTNYSPGLKHQIVANPKIKWEQSATTDVGLDATMFGNKLNVVLDVYNRKTIDLLYLKQLDPSLYGNVDKQPVNIGNMTNKGIDLSVSYKDNLTKDLKFDGGITFSLYRNKVGEIADPYLEGDGTRIDPFNRSVTGRAFASFYGYQLNGFFQNQADVDALQQQVAGISNIGKWRFKDITGPDGKPDGKITSDDRTWLGSPHPNFTMGFNLNVSYKGFDLASFFYWKSGGQIANYVRYWTDFNTFQGNRDKRVLYDSWTPTHTNAKLPALDASDGYSGQVPVSYYIEPGGYFRLRNLSLGYTLPSAILKIAGIERFRLYVQAQNVFTITKYTGLDPEITTSDVGTGSYKRAFTDTNIGVDKGNFPTPRIITVGVNVVF